MQRTHAHRKHVELRKAIAGGDDEVAGIIGQIAYHRGSGYDIPISTEWSRLLVEGYKPGANPAIFVRTNIFDSAFRDEQTFGDMSLEGYQKWVRLYHAAPEYVAKPLGVMREKKTNRFLGSIIENVHGIPLNQFIREHSTARDADPAVVDSIIKQLEAFVGKMHAKGLSHGDLGYNIILTQDNKIKIIDPKLGGSMDADRAILEHYKADLRRIAKRR